MIVDANDLGQEVIGHSDDIKLTEEELKGLIRDNPTGQGHEQTPLILIRKNQQIKNNLNSRSPYVNMGFLRRST